MKSAPQEIERKFLVHPDKLPKKLPKGEKFVQAYLSLEPAVRVRIVNGKRAYMTVKGEGLASREEIEFKIPLEKARYLLGLSPYTSINKTRYRLRRQGFVWELDVYEREFEGLRTVEVELESIDQPLTLPNFVGKDVTNDARYKNSSLAEQGGRSKFWL